MSLSKDIVSERSRADTVGGDKYVRLENKKEGVFNSGWTADHGVLRVCPIFRQWWGLMVSLEGGFLVVS